MTLRAAAIKRVRPIPLLFLLVGMTAWLGYWASYVLTPLPVPVAVHRRVLFDVIGVLVDIGFGARFLLFFAGTEGVGSVRMQTRICELRWRHRNSLETLWRLERRYSVEAAERRDAAGKPNIK